MIVQITLANYRSVHTEQTLSFVAERGTRHKDNLIPRPGYRLLKAAALFGANASGKSNFVRAIGEMRDFVRDSATKMNDGDPIVCAQPYRLDPASRSAPSRFEITFVTDGMQYVYGFAATRERVHEEWLTATRENSNVKLFDFQRSTDRTQGTLLFNASGFDQSVGNLLVTRTRDNALALSTAARENVKELLPAFRFLKDNVQSKDMSTETDLLVDDALALCKYDKSLFNLAHSLIRDADTGIEDVFISNMEWSGMPSVDMNSSESVESFYAAHRRILAASWQQRLTTSRRDTKGEVVQFDFEYDESIGTNRFFTSAVFLLDALQEGAFLVIDELDASMHPLLTRRLLEMFQSPDANPNGAQLLFTTHDAVLLDSALFRRDQIILAEKCNNESCFYSLADVVPPPRNAEVFLRNYLVGRYGGTPHLGPAFDMLTVESKA